MSIKNSGLRQLKSLETTHPLATHTSISSPCGKFKVRCKVNSLSCVSYELALLYHRQGLGERYRVGQQIQFYHETENWTLDVIITAHDGNLLYVDIIEPLTTLIAFSSSAHKTVHTCELLGQYCDLYRVSFAAFDQIMHDALDLRLPNGEQFHVRLRWREEDEICFQKIHINHSLVGQHRA